MRKMRTLLALWVGLAWLPAQDPAGEDLAALLNTPIISASRTRERALEAPASVIVLSRRELERRGYTQLFEILDDLPGFDLLMAYGPTFLKPYARGFRNNIGDAVLFMVDGQPLNHLWFNVSYAALAAMPLSHIQQVEIVYGPASAVYGANAFMGAINVITQRAPATGFSGEAILDRGTLGRRGADLTVWLQKGSWETRLTARRFQGDVDPDTADQYEYTSRTYLNRTIFGRLLDHHPGDGSSPYQADAVDLRVRRDGFEVGLQYLDLFSHHGRNYPTDRHIPSSGTWHKRESALFLQRELRLGERVSGETTVRYRRSDIPSDSLDFAVRWDPLKKVFAAFPQHWASVNSALGMSLDLAYRPREAPWSLQLGGVLSHETLEKGYRLSNPGDLYLPTATFDPAQVQDPAASSLSDGGHLGIERRGAYLQGRLEVVRGHQLVVGGRYDWHPFFHGATTLRMGYVGTRGDLTLKALHGQAYQEPSHRQFFGGWLGSGSSTLLQPERSSTTEVSATWTRPAWSLTADLYRIHNWNTILPFAGGAENLGTQHLDCLDLQAQGMVWLGDEVSLRLWAYLTRVFHHRGEPYTPRINVLGAEDVGDIPRTKLWYGLTAQFPRQTSLTLKGRTFAARRTVGTNPLGRVSGYTVLECFGQVQDLPWPGMSVGLKVTNLLDRVYAHPGLREADAGAVRGRFDPMGDWVGSAGFNTSLMPQSGRAFELLLRWRF